jgi:transketolase
MNGELPGELEPAITAYKKKLAEDLPTVATRKASEMALEVINGVVPETIGGSADLTGLQQHPDQPDQGHHPGRLLRPLHPLRYP